MRARATAAAAAAPKLARPALPPCAEQALAAQRERDDQMSKAQMAAALGGGASWGFGEDAFDEDGDRECLRGVTQLGPGRSGLAAEDGGMLRRLWRLAAAPPSPAPRSAVEDVDWRAYAATKGLSEKQGKLAEKLRKREARVTHLQREIDKIKVCGWGWAADC